MQVIRNDIYLTTFKNIAFILKNLAFYILYLIDYELIIIKRLSDGSR